MIKGMTGFGTAALAHGPIRGVVEIKSQNHRYLDIVYYLPTGFSSLEGGIRQAINKEIGRGRVIVSVKISEKPLAQLKFSRDAVKEYLKYSKLLKQELGFDDQLSLADLIKLPGVVEARETILDPDDLWPSIAKSLSTALRGLVTMRTREGRSLAADISRILKQMTSHAKRIQARAKAILQQKKKSLSDDEFLSFQKSSDISEELTRLIHYTEEFKILLKSEEGVGKKLDFVAQEMQRETNTIGSKFQDKIVSNEVIALKSKIEKLREQAQNIE